MQSSSRSISAADTFAQTRLTRRVATRPPVSMLRRRTLLRRTARARIAQTRVAQTRVAQTRAEGRLIADKGGQRRHRQAGGRGGSTRTQRRSRAGACLQARTGSASACARNRAGSGPPSSAHVIARRGALRTLTCRSSAGDEKEEGGMQQRMSSGDVCVRPCAHCRPTPCATARAHAASHVADLEER